jgi:hypothetical protein
MNLWDAVEAHIERMTGEQIDAFVGEFLNPEAGMALLREQIAAQVREEMLEAMEP